MRRTWLLLLTALILLNAVQALALKEEQRERVRRQISSVKVWQMTKELDLSEAQAQALFPAQNDYEARKEALRAERESAEAELERLLDQRADKGWITDQLNRIKEIDRRSGENELEWRNRMNSILTLEQQARYELFEKRFNQQLREMIKDVQREDRREGLDEDRPRREPPRDRQSRDSVKTRPEGTKRPEPGEKPREGGDERKSKEKDDSGSTRSSRDKTSPERESQGRRPTKR